MTLTKDVLTEKISSRSDFSGKESKDILETILEEIKGSLEKGEEVKISGFGKWSVKQKHSRVGRNPQTGKALEISARKVVTFHPSESFRSLVNQRTNEGRLVAKTRASRGSKFTYQKSNSRAKV